MSEEAIADSEGFDMDAAQEEISSDLFAVEETTETEEVETTALDSEDKETVTTEIDESTEDPVEDIRTAPQSWKKEMHESWGTLTPDVQEYIELRESQMREGLDQNKSDSDLGRSLRDVLLPFDEMITAQGMDQPTAIKYMMAAHQRLSTAPQEEKLGLINQLAESYGITLDGKEVSVETKALTDRLGYLESMVSESQQRSQQEQHDKVTKEIEAFASDPNHSYFDEVAEDIVPLVNAGLSLEDAYGKAIWANAVTRQKEMDRLEKEKTENLEKEKQEKIQKAKKAKSTNIKGRDTDKAPTEPTGKMFDDMSDLYQEIQNR